MQQNRKNQPTTPLIAIMAVAALFLSSAAVFFSWRQSQGPSTIWAPSDSTEYTTSRSNTPSTVSMPLPSPIPSAAATEPAVTTRQRDRTSIIPDGPSFDDISPDGKIDYSRIEYDSLVPESEPVDDTYFDDALFIGNSIQQIQRQIGSIRADYITTGDYNIFRYFEWQLNMPDGVKMTTAHYLTTRTYKKIYLTFGINEVSYDDQEAVWQGYRALLTDVRQKQPAAIIYLVGLLPVYPPLMNETAKALITPEKILEFNHKLAILAEDEGIHMLNPAQALQDDSGYLDPDWSRDGVHFGKAATDRWDAYTRTHTVTP